MKNIKLTEAELDAWRAARRAAESAKTVTKPQPRQDKRTVDRDFLSDGLSVRHLDACLSTSDAKGMEPSRSVVCAHCGSDETMLDKTTNGGFIEYCPPSDRTCAEAAVVFACSRCGGLTAQWISTDACGWSGLSYGKIERAEVEHAYKRATETLLREVFELGIQRMHEGVAK